MSDIVFSMSADEKDVTRALQNTGKEFGKLRDQIMSLATASNEQGKAEAALSQQRLAALAPIIAKQKELKAVMDDLGKQLKDGKISQDQYNAAVKSNAESSDQLTQKLRELQTQVQEDTADMRKAAAVIGQVEDKTEKYSRSVAELDRLKAKGILTSKQHALAIEAEKKKLEDVGGGADKSGGLISGLTQKMSGFVAGLAGSVGIVQTLRAEYQNLIELQGKSKNANISLAAEQEALLGNLGDADAAQLFASIKETSVDSKIKEQDVTRAVNEAMAARADLGLEDVLAGVSTAAKVRKFAPNELAGLSAAAIDTKKQTGLDMDQSMGFLMQMLPQSRVKSLKGVAENFTPAVGGLMQQGADRQTAAALLTTISHGMGDVTGERSRTAGLSLGGQLRSFAPGQEMGTTIAQLQKDKAARDKFLSTATFEVAARPAIESLLSGGQQAQQFAAAKRAFAEDPRKALERGVAARAASGSITIAEKDLGLGNLTNQMELNDKQGAMSSVFRDRLSEMKKRSHGSTFTMIDDVVEDMKGQDTESAIKKLGLIRNRNWVENTKQMDADGVRTKEEHAARLETDKMFSRMVGELERLNATQQQALSTQKQTVHAGAAVGRRDRQGENAP